MCLVCQLIWITPNVSFTRFKAMNREASIQVDPKKRGLHSNLTFFQTHL